MKAAAGVSVIVCTWNRAATLDATLSSLAAATPPPGTAVEVLVVDNNSTDATRAVVQARQAGWPAGELRYLHEARQGKQFALNHGIAAARHAVLAFTDDDIVFPTDWLQRIANVFADDDAGRPATVELAGGITRPTWPDGGPPAWFAPEMMAVVGGVDLGPRRLDPAPANYAPAGANLVARRSLFDRVGGFSEAHFRHMDHEFGTRCQRLGARVVYEPSLVVEAPVDAQILTRRYFRRWAFKAGIAADPGERRGAVPRWMLRQIAGDAAWLATAGLFAAAAPAFARELRLRRRLGTVADALYARWRPAAHAGWVQRHSQKTNNVY